MVDKFPVLKFTNIEDKLAGLVNFKQLFSLLGAFLLTFFIFRINQLIGIVIGLVSFGLAIVFTFFYINGKPFLAIFPSFLDFLRNRKFVWQKITKIKYESITIPANIKLEAEVPEIKARERKILTEETKFELKYPDVNPSFKEEVVISLSQPISSQAEKINRFIHRHLVNPKNPYRLFPYIKFYQKLK